MFKQSEANLRSQAYTIRTLLTIQIIPTVVQLSMIVGKSRLDEP